MNYVLRQIGLGQSTELPITENEYRELSHAREVLSCALNFEQLYETIILSHLDFEKEVASVSTTYLVRNLPGNLEHFDSMVRVNLRIISLLTTAKMYLDQTPQLLGKIALEHPDIKSAFKPLTSSQYDAELYYRFIEELRNYVQHCGLPSHSSSMGWSLFNSNDPESHIEINTHFFAKRDQLAKDKKFKNKILNELEEDIDLRLALRIYVASLSQIHIQTRELVDPLISKSRDVTEQAIKKYEAVCEQLFTPICACCSDQDSKEDQILLILRGDDIRLQLKNRNQLLQNLRKSYVSGATSKQQVKNKQLRDSATFSPKVMNPDSRAEKN
jgi:hypothetical protein